MGGLAAREEEEHFGEKRKKHVRFVKK